MIRICRRVLFVSITGIAIALGVTSTPAIAAEHAPVIAFDSHW